MAMSCSISDGFGTFKANERFNRDVGIDVFFPLVG